MKRLASLLLILLLTVPSLSLAAEADPAKAPRAVIELLYQGEFQQVFDKSVPDVQASLGSADGLSAFWAQIGSIYGAFAGITGATAETQAGYTVGYISCDHETATITYSVALDAQGLLAGLTISAAVPKITESTADQTQFVTEPITLRAGEADETQGLLTLPKGDGPFPAVLMMQGSGPSDRDETAFGIAPFRDLAEGLALAGIASIRYDKYTYAHADLLKADPALLQAFTVEQEYINDARAALSLLEADTRIGDVYLLGHSLGGMIVPRVMFTLGAERFAGGIVLEGSPLPMWEIQYHQNLALIPQLEEGERETARQQVDAEAARLEQLKAMSDAELQAAVFFGISAYYQMDLASVNAAQTAIEVQKPLLITQGGKDWQVTPADGIDAWKAALGGMAGAAYLEYPNMNHILCEMEGDPAGTTADYAAGSTVSQALIGDIAAWIKGK